MNQINEVDKPIVKKTIVVYAGRFQPFHKGHYAAYSKLVSKFGSDNVYIGTSNDTSGPKSPFTFNEKKKIATTMFGIPQSRFVNIKNPYKPVEILKGFDEKTTQYVAAVGEKDAARLQGKYFKAYNGKAGYGYEEIGYVYPVPAEQNPISGTDVRNYLGGDDVDKAKKFFLRAYPKFNQSIFDIITDKIKSKKVKSLSEYSIRSMGTGTALDFGPRPASYIDDEDSDISEDGLPGGAFTGLVSSAGYIGGAPKPKDVKKLSKKLHKGDIAQSHTKYVYDPISEILSNIAAEELFNEFVKGYFNEAETNPMLDKDIDYTRTNGEKAKIKVRDALRLKKDHPAHIQAKKILGTEKPQPKAETKPEDTSDKDKKDKSDKQPVEKGDKEAPKVTEPDKLSGTELKSDAEQTPDEKRDEKLKQSIDTEKEKLSDEDKQHLDNLNNPESKERKGLLGALKKGMKAIGGGVKHMIQHKKEMIGGSIDAVKSLATGGKLGMVKDDKGKSVHWSDFAKTDAKGKPHMEDVPVYKKDSHGHSVKGKDGKPIQDTDKKGNPKTEKKPIFFESNSEEKELFEKSWGESKKQKGALKGLAIETALLVGSIAVTGGLIGGVSAASKGAGVAGIAKGAASKIAYKFGGGHFAQYLAKDIVKHSAFESLGASGLQASAGGIALGASGIFEAVKDENVDPKRFMKNYIGKTIETIKNYKLSDEQMLDVIKRYKEEEPKGDAQDLLKESVSKSKIQNISDFVEYSTKRLKLKDKPSIKLILSNTYSEQNSTLGGYSPDTKDIMVVVPKRMTADICRTIAHELIHRKQDEMGYIKDRNTAGQTGSPIENQANALAGILLRDYGKINKSIYLEGLVLNEVSNMNGGNGSEARPDGAFLPKGAARKLGASDGYNNSDKWYTYGGYIQLEFPKADAIFGDEDQNKLIIQYVASNLPRQTQQPTKFTKNPDKAKIISEMGRNDIHFKNIFQHYRDGDSKMKQKIAKAVTGNPYAKIKEILKELREMEYIDIVEIEDEIGIPIKEFKNIDNTRYEVPASPPVVGDQIDVFNYTKPKVIKENIEEWNQLLLEGGAYGHMSHPFDDMELTFGQLKDIISKALDGELGVVREKTDGQALAISWKNGRLIAARNKGHLQNAGANAMGIEDVASKFAGRGGLTDAYNYAMRDLSTAIAGLSNKQRSKIFNEGKCFMNIEVIWPTSVNVIPYGQALLVFHNTTCYNESGVAISSDQSAAGILAGMIKQVNADVQSKYTIQGPPITSIPKNQNLSSLKEKYLTKLSKLQSEFGLAAADTMALYHQSWWEDYIDKNTPAKIDSVTKESLVKRWAFGDKSFRLNTISNEDIVKWAIDTDKMNVAKQQKENMQPFEEIFLGVGADVLTFVSSVLTVHPDAAIRNMKERLKDTADKVRKVGNTAQIQKLKMELTRLSKLGGIDKIVASEGLVFFYNGKTYKLTGSFAALNQILGIFYE